MQDYIQEGTSVRKLGRLTALGFATAVVAVGLVACGDDDSGGSSGGGQEGGSINGTLTSFPDSLDPQDSYTLEGWEGLYNVYVPLLTYKHVAGDAGTEVVPASRRRCPRSPLTARPTSSPCARG